jgi:hypothetical protein
MIKMTVLGKEASLVEKTIRAIMWNGIASAYLNWQEKLLANAKRRGFKGFMTGKEKVPQADDDIDKDLNKDERRARELNELR